ncbi:MAG: nitroreductase family protein, partial [Sulfurovum sp.]
LRPVSTENVSGLLCLSVVIIPFYRFRSAYFREVIWFFRGDYIGIDSCPIEGFEKEKVETVLGLDTSKYQVAALVPFGYRINEQPTQLRLPFEQVVEFIK